MYVELAEKQYLAGLDSAMYTQLFLSTIFGSVGSFRRDAYLQKSGIDPLYSASR